MPFKKPPHSAALRYLHRELIGDDPERLESLEAERVNADIAQKIYELRIQAGLTQAELAKLAHTTASVICRLEEADYHRCTLRLLCRVATALNRRVVVSLVSVSAKQSKA